MKSLNTTLYGIKAFYAWLVENGELEKSPVAGIPGDYGPAKPRDTLSISELRSMWDAARHVDEQGLVALLGLNGLRLDEALGIDVSHVSEEQGLPVVRLQKRTRYHGHPVTVLAPQVHAVVEELVGGRRTGPLLRRRDGQALDRRTALRWVKTMGQRASIPFSVTALSLTYSLRVIGMNNGFSYIGVVRAVGEIEPARAKRWMQAVSAPLDQHGALRLTRLVLGPTTQTEGMLDNAAVCLSETDMHPAVTVMAAGAALEAHLRAMTALTSLQPPDSNRAKIGTYVGLLTSARAITVAENQALMSIAQYRDDAAHGWFDRIDKARAEWVLSECRRFVAAHRLQSSNN